MKSTIINNVACAFSGDKLLMQSLQIIKLCPQSPTGIARARLTCLKLYAKHAILMPQSDTRIAAKLKVTGGGDDVQCVLRIAETLCMCHDGSVFRFFGDCFLEVLSNRRFVPEMLIRSTYKLTSTSLLCTAASLAHLQHIADGRQTHEHVDLSSGKHPNEG